MPDGEPIKVVGVVANQMLDVPAALMSLFMLLQHGNQTIVNCFIVGEWQSLCNDTQLLEDDMDELAEKAEGTGR